MVLKILSLATALVTLDVYQQSQLHSANLIFLFISDNLAVNIALVVLAAAAVAASFVKRFKYWEFYILCAGGAAVLSAWGLVGLLFSNQSSWFTASFMPLDYVLILLVGIILGISALSHPRPRRRLFGPLRLRQRLPRPSPSYAFGVGKMAISKLTSLLLVPVEPQNP